MKKYLSFLLALAMVLTVFTVTYAREADTGATVAEMTERLNAALPSDSPFEFVYVGTRIAESGVPGASIKSIAGNEDENLYGFRLVIQYDGYYIEGDGVNVRTRPSISAPSIGLLYDGDIVWYDPFESWPYADGHYWIHVITDSLSNMGQQDGYMVTDYLGEPW